MVKFDNLYNVEAIYYIRMSRGRYYCNCPAYKQPTCKHRDMIHTFMDNKAVDSGKFLHYDTGEWIAPLIDVDQMVQNYQKPRKV